MVVTDELSGGTVEFEADHLYVWDEDNTEWDLIGPSVATTLYNISGDQGLAEGDGSSLNNVSIAMPVGFAVVKAIVHVETAWTNAETLTLGITGGIDTVMLNSEIDLQTVGDYVIDCYVPMSAGNYMVADYTEVGAGGTGEATVFMIAQKG